jgi:sugar phosphate isomerase/epimerase
MSQPICLQLYTIRDAMSADWKASLARVAQIGYAGVEVVYTDKIPATAFKAELDRHNLIVSTKSSLISNCSVPTTSFALGVLLINAMMQPNGVSLCMSSK